MMGAFVDVEEAKRGRDERVDGRLLGAVGRSLLRFLGLRLALHVEPAQPVAKVWLVLLDTFAALGTHNHLGVEVSKGNAGQHAPNAYLDARTPGSPTTSRPSA